MRNTVPGWRPWSASSFLFVLPSILKTIEATSIKWLFANQFEEITWNPDADSNSKANSPWYSVLIHHYPGHNSQNATVNSFHWNVDKFVRFFFLFLFLFCFVLFFFMCVVNFVNRMWVIFQYIVPTDTPKSSHVQQAIVWTFFIVSHPLFSPFTLVSRFAGNPRLPRIVRKASVMQATTTLINIRYLFTFLTPIHHCRLLR